MMSKQTGASADAHAALKAIERFRREDEMTYWVGDLEDVIRACAKRMSPTDWNEAMEEADLSCYQLDDEEDDGA